MQYIPPKIPKNVPHIISAKSSIKNPSKNLSIQRLYNILLSNKREKYFDNQIHVECSVLFC